MTKKGDSRFDVNSAEVQAVLYGVVRSGPQTYHRINGEGQRTIVPIRRELMETLNICTKSATKLLKEAAIPYAPYRNEVQQQPVDPEPEPDSEAMMLVALEAAAKETTREEKLAKKAELEQRANSRRWQYIETSSGKCGIYDNDNATVVALYYTKQEAIEELTRLRTGSSQVGVYYYGSRTRRQPDLQEINY